LNKPKKKLRKRDLDKYPALNPRLNARTRYEVLDMDYLRDLDDAELKYLNKFMAEYVSGAFKKNGDGTYSDDNFYKTIDERRERWRNNNARNRCGLTIANATGMAIRSDDIAAVLDDVFLQNMQYDNKVEELVIGIESFGGQQAIDNNIAQKQYEDYLLIKSGTLDEESLAKMGSAYIEMLLRMYNT
jgi:hypothetical protein